MGEIGSGTGSSYPGALDTDNTPEVNSPNAGKTKARAEVPNDLAGAVVAIETELGTDVAGTLTDVKTYLQTEHNTDGTHNNTLVAMLAGDQTFTDDKTFEGSNPQVWIRETDAAADEKLWLFTAGAGTFFFRAHNDAKTVQGTIFSVARTGTTIDNMDIQTVLKANSGIQTDGTNTLKTKVIDIGDWNMDATASVNVAHGLTATNIRAVDVIIRDDAASLIYPLTTGVSGGGAIDGFIGLLSQASTNVTLARTTGGTFDNTSFDATSYNRGWVTITYTA